MVLLLCQLILDLILQRQRRRQKGLGLAPRTGCGDSEPNKLLRPLGRPSDLLSMTYGKTMGLARSLVFSNESAIQ